MSGSGSRRSSVPRSRCLHGRSGFSSLFKSTLTGTGSQREAQPLLQPPRHTSPPVRLRDSHPTSSLSSSSNSGSYKGSDSSPTPRRSNKYTSCSENHGIKPPTPEQYLTPLQQKEVCIRHLKAKLKETQEKLKEREAEVEDLKLQLGRMQEDWIEEECHRVEAQLSLKEARKEIQQLKQVIETVKENLVEKDRGIQQYFVDINIQNRKLESLLHSIERAQEGEEAQEGEGSTSGSPARSLLRSNMFTELNEGEARPQSRHTLSAEDSLVTTGSDVLLVLSDGELLAPAVPGVPCHWSRHYLLDLLAVTVPVLPTLMWIFCTQRGGTQPLYNISCFLRTCCLVALGSLRTMSNQEVRETLAPPLSLSPDLQEDKL
ncbi:syntaphilin [Callorhinchus milii]|uniref:syntaphilin n=1 Tax=Callorhinchus milii TaxID=7868 RepID=UPI001C3F71BB|nr:syntaphilin [Callorhinchus milii]